MKTSNKGILAILTHEGIVPGPYLDSVGVLTAFVGHTKAAGGLDPANLVPGMPDDIDGALIRAFEVFREDLLKFEERVNKAIKVEISQEMFDAAMSFDINTGGIFRADWVRKLNVGDVDGAARAIMNWKKPKEIISRRKAEQRLFRDGIYPETKITVWGVDKRYNVIWRPAKVLTSQEALSLLRGGIRDEITVKGSSRAYRSPAAVIGALIGATVAAASAFACKIPFLNSFISTCGG